MSNFNYAIVNQEEDLPKVWRRPASLLRDEINADVEAFLAAGGKIQVLPPEVIGGRYKFMEDISCRTEH